MSNMEAFNKFSSDINKKLIKDLIDAIRDTQETKDEPVSLQCVVCNAIYEDKVSPKVQRKWVEIDNDDWIKALELADFDKMAAFEFFENKLKELNT
jgi:hypothetical protein